MKMIEFVAGYHEWQVIVDDVVIHAFDDFSDEIKEDMTEADIDSLVDDLIYGWQMSFENDCDSLDEGESCPITPIWETHGTELRNAMENAICEHYGIRIYNKNAPKELYWIVWEKDFICSQRIEEETETHVKLLNRERPIPKECIDNENKPFRGRLYFSTEQAAIEHKESMIGF